MKILLVNHFPLEGSGSGTYTKNLAMQLVQCGHQVCVVMPENTGDYLRYQDVRLHPVLFSPEDAQLAEYSLTSKGNVSSKEGADSPEPLPFNFPCFTTHPRSTVSFGDLSPEQLAAYTQAFSQAIKQEVEHFRPDIIHGQHVWILSALAAGLDIPLVLTAHGTDLMGYQKWPQLRRYAQDAMDACTYVICISKDNESLVRQTFPQHQDKIRLMRNGYNPAIFYPEQLDAVEVLHPYGVDCLGRRIVLFAGKLTDFKGVDVLLDAAALYEPLLPDVLTLLAGDGQLSDQLQGQAVRLGLRNVHFLGNVTQEELRRLYNIASVDVVPSRREPFGLVAVEALACGTPVVATNEGGLPDFVTSAVGALVPVGDATALSDAIQATLARVLHQPHWRQSIATYASSSYSQAVIIGELEELYRSAHA